MSYEERDQEFYRSQVRPILESAVETFKDRLSEAIGEKSIHSFARKCGISISGFRRYLNDGTPTLENLIAISIVGGVDLNWLALGKKPANENKDEIDSGGSNTAYSAPVLVSIVCDIQALSDEEGWNLKGEKLAKTIALVYGMQKEGEPAKDKAAIKEILALVV